MTNQAASTTPATLHIPGQLPRLDYAWYRGNALVLWTHALRERATGWLDDTFHARFRELLTHTCARHHLACPAYVLMPDHLHFVWLGFSPKSDQRIATKFLREHVAPLLSPHRLQPQEHDRVLRDDARTRGALASTCHYVFSNPVRAQLAQNWPDWTHLGALIPGYPNLNPRDEDYWARFWRIHGKLADLSSAANP